MKNIILSIHIFNTNNQTVSDLISELALHMKTFGTLIVQNNTKLADPMQKCESTIVTSKLSDHFACIIGFSILVDKQKYITRQLITDNSIRSFKLDMKKDIDTLLQHTY